MAAAGRGAGSRGVTALQRAQELCEFCPKMCRFVCPVSEAARREALTPWAKVSLAALSAREPDASTALMFAGCTGCDRCAHHCAHDNDVPAILFAARATAVRAGVAPRPWTELALRFSARGHGETADLAAVRRTLPDARGEAGLFARCGALPRGGAGGRPTPYRSGRAGAPPAPAPRGGPPLRP